EPPARHQDDRRGAQLQRPVAVRPDRSRLGRGLLRPLGAVAGFCGAGLPCVFGGGGLRSSGKRLPPSCGAFAMKEPARLLVSLLSATAVAALAPASAGASDEVTPDLEPTLVVAPDGDDSAVGSLDDPFATVQHAVDLAEPGDVISVRGGTYALDDQNITIAT